MLLANGDGDYTTITCSCGEENCPHGEIRISRTDSQDQEHTKYVELTFLTHISLWERIKLAWSILRGKPLPLGFHWNRQMCTELGDWLIGDPQYVVRSQKDELKSKVYDIIRGITTPE